MSDERRNVFERLRMPRTEQRTKSSAFLGPALLQFLDPQQETTELALPDECDFV